MMDDLTEDQMLALDDMVERRMASTGEDRRTACMEVKKYLCQHLARLRGIDLSENK